MTRYHLPFYDTNVRQYINPSYGFPTIIYYLHHKKPHKYNCMASYNKMQPPNFYHKRKHSLDAYQTRNHHRASLPLYV